MLKSIELTGFKSFGRKSELHFTSPIAAIVGPNGSGKSNVAEGFRFVLGEQSMKSLRSKKGEDLIWGGSPGLPRQNRAAVKIVFDNRHKLLALDFPEVAIERVVYRDGVNEYLINGTKVRLRDVAELLAAANIGASGYHIISQGEADRVLSASPRERREMVEEALGLRLFQNRKAESEKKLEETAQNIEQVASLRREIAPHLRYLQKQVERIEKAQEMAGTLAGQLSDYLARENVYIMREGKHLREAQEELSHQIAVLDREVAALQGTLAARSLDVGNEDTQRVAEAEARLVKAREAREEASRALGRAEGELSALRSVGGPGEEDASIAKAEVHAFLDGIAQLIFAIREAGDSEAREKAMAELSRRVEDFRSGLGKKTGGESDAVRSALARVESLTASFKEAQEEEQQLERSVAALREELSALREAHHSAERELIGKRGERREAAARLATLDEQIAEIARLKERFDEEVREGIVLVGGATLSFESTRLPEEAYNEPRSAQESRRRDIERLKIKIEEYRDANADSVLKEYDETRERDAFLERELADLTHSAESLRNIIVELEKDIDVKFSEGLSLIRNEFNAFFTQLFGGGKASLDLEKPRVAEEGEEVPEAGLSVSVQLPRKQVRGLEVLSGGERALTSIALIFAMSQVNPPPFLILDETDAALDEANSRRYATIVESLAKKSQLILITHNRATMSAAGELYGVTMGQDGVSKLLSVKFDEAVQVAK